MDRYSSLMEKSAVSHCRSNKQIVNALAEADPGALQKETIAVSVSQYAS